MLTLKDWLEAAEYHITEADSYQWNCYGPDAHILDSWNGDHDGHTLSIIFDKKTQVVYESSAYDYANNRAYRFINPDYREAQSEEAEQRSINNREAWEGVSYTDLEVQEDFLDKAWAIHRDQEYDTRVQVPLEFSDEELLTYMKMAHDRDMTFNAFIEMVLREFIDKMRDEYDFSNAQPHFSNTDNPIDFPIPKEKKKKKGKK